MFSRFLCAIGIHGPLWFGTAPHQTRSRIVAPFTRKCTLCEAQWRGEADQLYRSPCNWRRVK